MKIQLRKAFVDGSYMVEVITSEGQIKKLKNDVVYEAEIKEIRSYPFLQKFFVLVTVGFNNSKRVARSEELAKTDDKVIPLTKKSYRSLVIMKAGYVDMINTGKGIMVLPKSIAFDNMDEETFADLYSRALDFIIEDTEADRELFEKELAMFI